MTDTVMKAGGKHAALWERMRAQKRPQMIHRCKTQVKQEPTEEIAADSNDKTAIPMSITMSPENSQDESQLMGIQIADTAETQEQQASTKDPCSWAMMDYGEHKRQEDSLAASFLSASTFEDAPVMNENAAGGIPKTPAAKSKILDTANGLTPDMLLKDWQQEEASSSQEEQNNDLLQQSMIISEDSPSEKQSVASLEESISSIPLPMTPGTEMVLTPSPTSPLTAMRRNSMHQALEETNDYVKRIQELEQALRLAKQEARSFTAKGQYTPSNFTTFDGASSPLLERNKTLVKEVKFAEQTCVELSQRNAALEQQVQRLETQLYESRQENESLLQEMMQSNRDCATLQAEKDALQVNMSNTVELANTRALELQKRLQTLQEENQQLRLGNENCMPSPMRPTSSTTSTGSPTSQVLAKTLQTQLQRGYSESDKLHQLEMKLAETEKALRETKRELAHCTKDQSLVVLHQQQQDESHGSIMSSELELARAHAKLANVSKQLQTLQVAESSARHALTQAKLEIDALQREKSNIMNHESVYDGDRQLIAELQATVQQLMKKCQEYDNAAAVASNKMKSLEYELSLARQQVVLERERLQEEFYELTQQALGNVERQSLTLDRQIQKRTQQFTSKLASLTSAVQYLQENLDFQSENGSISSSVDQDNESAASPDKVNASSSTKSEEDNSQGTVLNATFHQSQSGTRSINEEMLLEQMEEARPVDNHVDSVGHEVIEDLSFIADLSHLYEDLSGLLMIDPTSPARNAGTGNQMASPVIKSAANASSAEKPSVQISFESVEHEFRQLKEILDRAQSATAVGDNAALVDTVEEQTIVIQSLEQKLGDLIDQARKSEAERRQLNVAVLEMSKAYHRCHNELKETSETLKASQDAEAEAKTEIQQTLEGLLSKLQDKERMIAALQSEKEPLSSTSRRISDSSIDLLRKQDEDTVRQLQREVELKNTQVESAARSYIKLSDKVKALESVRKEHETRVSELQESVSLLEAAKSEIEAKYNEATSTLRSLSRERDQQKQELLRAKCIEEELRREVANCSETIKVQRGELEIINTEHANTIDRNAKLSKTVDELTNIRSNLLQEVDQLKATVTMLESELDYLKVSYITCNDKLADASERNASKDEIVAKFQSSNRAAKEAIASYEERLSLLTSELEKTESERTVLQERVVAMEKELRATATDFVSYKNGMEEKLSKRNDFIEDIQSTAEALKRTYEHQLTSLTMEHEALKNKVRDAVSTFLNDFQATHSESLKSLMQIGFDFNYNEVNLSFSDVDEHSWSRNLRAASQQLSRWKQVIAECSQVIAEYQSRLYQAEEMVESLTNEAHHFKDDQSKIEETLRDQELRTQSLVHDLRVAEAEAIQSSRKIEEMSNAFVATKRELARVSQLLVDKTDLRKKTEELILEREEAESRLSEMTRSLAMAEKKLKAAVDESGKLRAQIREKDQVSHELESQNVSLDRKCNRLRDYIRKLTNKCEEWAEYAEKQSKVIHNVKAGREKANVEQEAQTSSYTAVETPPSLEVQGQDRTEWSVERRMLDRVANLAGEDDLDALASELKNFGLKEVF